MCGIFGYLGTSPAAPLLFSGLKRLEYRGYDSWGIAVLDNSGLRDVRKYPVQVLKRTGALEDLPPVEAIRGTVGIGHTRWATHGRVTHTNAHPLESSEFGFVLAHNGIVENFQEIKAELSAGGETFSTQTDTETIVKLIERSLRERGAGREAEAGLLREAVRDAFMRIRGRNGIILLVHDGGDQECHRVLAARSGSPLVIGLGEGECFFASDTLSFADKTNRVLYIDDFQLAECTREGLRAYDLRTLKEIVLPETTLERCDAQVSRSGHPHFMLKEILEQEHTLTNALMLEPSLAEALVAAMMQAGKVYTTGAGGALFTAQQTAYYLRTIAGLQAHAIPAYEAEGYVRLFRSDDMLLAVSQSGETADTLETVRYARQARMRVAGVVNMLGSTLARISDFHVSSRSGPEICVLSTKSASAQMIFGWFLAMLIEGREKEALGDVRALESYLGSYLKGGICERTKHVAERLTVAPHVFVLGKGRNSHIAQIGALNIKEASYIHAEAFSAGELKHGVIALVEDGVPVICFVDDDEDAPYMLNACAEVKARGACVIGLATKENELFDEFLPLPTLSGLDAAVAVNIIPCQLLAYHLAVANGRDPDKPRNLAKSVTVR